LEAGGFGVAVTVAPAAAPAAGPAGGLLGEPLPAGVSRRASRLTDLLDPAGFDDAGLAGELAAVRRARAQLAGYEAAVITELARRRPAVTDLTDQPGAGAEGWLPDRAPVGVSEFLADELALLAGVSRATAVGLAERSLALTGELPQVWAGLADGRIDDSQARAITAVLRGQSVGAGGPVSPDLVAEVAARAVGWAAGGELPARLRNRTAAALLAVDAAADRRRQRAQQHTDVTVRGGRDGMAELVTDLPTPVAAACREAVDGYARMLKADGDLRPIGQLRSLLAADLILRPWDTGRAPVTASLTVLAYLDALTTQPPPRSGAGRPGCPEHPAGPTATAGPGTGYPEHPAGPTATAGPGTGAGQDGGRDAGRGADGAAGDGQIGWVDGLPVTAAQLRGLLAGLNAVFPGGLRAPAGGSLDIALLDPATGALRATLTRPQLERLARRGCPRHPDHPPGPDPAATQPDATGASCGCPVLDRPPPVHRYRPTPAQRRFIRARDRTCRHPGCRRPAARTDIDHVTAHADGGPTDCANLCCLCRRHHRLKTHAPGWTYRMRPDGVLQVTTPSGTTHTTRPPGLHLPDDLLLTPIGPPTTGQQPPDDDPPPF
jgi:hypothetical protein